LVRDGKDGKSSQGVFMLRGGARSLKNNNNHSDKSNDDNDGLILITKQRSMHYNTLHSSKSFKVQTGDDTTTQWCPPYHLNIISI
jgi:hypothetical protein